MSDRSDTWHCPHCYRVVPLPPDEVMRGIPICEQCWSRRVERIHLYPGWPERRPLIRIAGDSETMTVSLPQEDA